MHEIPGQEPEPVRVSDLRQLYMADSLGMPIDPDSEIRAETDAEAIVIGSFGLRVNGESAERLEAQAEPFDERIAKAREAFSKGERATTEYLLGYKLTDEEWEDLLRRNLESSEPSDESGDLGFSLN